MTDLAMPSEFKDLLDDSHAPFWIVGAGNMAGSMIQCWLKKGIKPQDLLVIRPSGKPISEGVSVVTHIEADQAAPATLLLGVKPQMLATVAPNIASHVDSNTILISVLAGVELATLREYFPKAGKIVRAMPNLPVSLGKGVTALCAESLDQAQRQFIDQLMGALGVVEWVREDQFDTATAVAGCGPAFVYRFIDALAKAGEKLGLTADQALPMALATVEGAAAMAKQSDISPHALAEKVASPGGSTRKGMDVLDQDNALFTLIERTLEASFKQNRYMAEMARKNKP
ncbi:pyrroline-5-carboxylate reductase [Zymomonas mobilis]|uniref:Pyrroline-5-carboxylate reductase n=1 Tax=Zymomonas mobilis subsp. pomaceae (strain ATCC 29192 / DSM 22645 / JCM 10191 / CCUG 17912 / NBRC 13757 / NCIMB 11200 / NRRL B-4491 / Barker I) TaxID=579138 RepID=F8ET50_ZYMMT|nr:pyrroline-5-carboxylate reductase [Zymomonas mobilis]AEI36940.1 pyrroline-5-carboxylate reductase [Zymomonas mobilis subsp. pomaceae ATCC 29192]MDX5948313.1 pyrroline-5-carboxylate reductase [Zymomonas mobilis subsp. pomaceae]GEB89068.1 pyrroline-5-carboxylate reductase [Zymomonas mobilis subsp. pomaceae]